VSRLFKLYDVHNEGVIGFDQVKRVARELGENITDDELKDMLHSVHVINRTEN